MWVKIILEVLFLVGLFLVLCFITHKLAKWMVKRQKKYNLAEQYRRNALRYKAKLDAENGTIMDEAETLKFIEEHNLDILDFGEKHEK